MRARAPRTAQGLANPTRVDKALRLEGGTWDSILVGGIQMGMSSSGEISDLEIRVRITPPHSPLSSSPILYTLYSPRRIPPPTLCTHPPPNKPPPPPPPLPPHTLPSLPPALDPSIQPLVLPP